MYELGNNILFAKVETFAADLNVKQHRGGGYGGNLIHGFSNLQYFLIFEAKDLPDWSSLQPKKYIVKEQVPRY